MIEKFLPSLKYKSNKIPVLSFLDIEQLALEIIKDYNAKYLSHPCAFDVDDFIEFYLGCEIEIVHLSHNQCYFGRYVFNDDEIIPAYFPERNQVYRLDVSSNTILLDAYLTDASERENLRRFTLMHEAGHGVQHQRYYKVPGDQLSLFSMDDYKIHPAISTSSSILQYGARRLLETNEDWLEYQANTFASCMLMNRKALEILLRANDYSLQVSQLQRISIIEIISKTFGVSHEAARVRLEKYDDFLLEASKDNSVSLF